MTIDEWIEITGNTINKDDIEISLFDTNLTKNEIIKSKREVDQEDGYYLPIQYETSPTDIDIILYVYIKKNSENTGKHFFDSKKAKIIMNLFQNRVG